MRLKTLIRSRVLFAIFPRVPFAMYSMGASNAQSLKTGKNRRKGNHRLSHLIKDIQNTKATKNYKNSKNRNTKKGFLSRQFGRLRYLATSLWLDCVTKEDNDLDDLDMPVVRYKPEGLAALCKNTKFTKKELQLMYRGFKQECPTGIVNEEGFKEIYAQFFPHGDSSAYAHFVFNTFDQDHTGSINFEQFVLGLSVLSRGSLQDKLQWAFSLYDINGDGVVSKDEMLELVAAIYDLLGKWSDPPISEHTTREHVDAVFQKMDINKDGVITLDEFLQSCQQDEMVQQSMVELDSVLT